MTKRAIQVTVLVALVAMGALPCFSQPSTTLQNYFKQNLKLSQDQINDIRNGQPYAVALPSRTPDEIVVFGAVYINADPASYVSYAYDFDRLRHTPGILAINKFSSPPQLSDMKGFELDRADVESLKSCTPGNCAIQLPGRDMEALRKSVDFSAPNAAEQVNQYFQNTAVSRLQLYQKEGGKALGAVYDDKKQQVSVFDQFQYILSYAKAMPQEVPAFYNYIVNYPGSGAANLSSLFYWDNVKFGLKPTLRIVQVVIMKGTNPQEPAYAIAEKQLYSSHYFETALDLTYCISDSDNPKQPGFYLVTVMGSEQAGLTGFEGSIIRREAVSHTVSGTQQTLATIKNGLEHK